MAFRWNCACSCCTSTNTRSPGSTPGCCTPASPRSVIFCPCFIPGSTFTSKTFRSGTTFFPWQRYLLPVLHPRLHVHLEDLPLRDHLLPLAGFAAVPRGDHLARARALRAGHLHLLDHGPHLPDLDDHA